jgi:hypothetical protein
MNDMKSPQAINSKWTALYALFFEHRPSGEEHLGAGSELPQSQVVQACINL